MPSSIFQRLRKSVPNAKFYPPATPKQIAHAERALSFRFPKWLRDLYLRSSGIMGTDAVFLWPLERVEEFPETLLSWNQFHRKLWDDTLTQSEFSAPPADQWGNPHNLLLISSNNDVAWAIEPGRGKQILLYDVRNPDHREVIASDFVAACIEHEKLIHETEERLFRGREPYRNEYSTSPVVWDIEHLFDVIVSIHKDFRTRPGVQVNTGWYLKRAISRRRGERGEMFILNLGGDDEVRVVTRNGNFPFVMRLKVWPFKSDLSCIVWCVKDALLRILQTVDAIRLPWIDANHRPTPDEAKLRQIWRDAGMPDPELERMADVLCARDDRRLEEENRLG